MTTIPGIGLRRALGVAGSCLLLGLVLAGLWPAEVVAAQGTSQAAGSVQMRHFWHVFAAYAVAWILLFSWVVSILRRLRKVESRIDRPGELGG